MICMKHVRLYTKSIQLNNFTVQQCVQKRSSEIIILKKLLCPMVTQKHTKLGLVPALLIVKPKINFKKVELFCAGISSQQIGDQSRLGN